jgi:hypothetical protein
MHVGAHFPSEQKGEAEGHAVAADQDAHVSFAFFSHVSIELPSLHATSPGVHQAPQGRCARST